jgi:hypothetical protein
MPALPMPPLPPPNVRRQIIQDMLQLWTNTAYQTTLELHIQAALSQTLNRSVQETVGILTARQEDCAVAIDRLTNELAAIEG